MALTKQDVVERVANEVGLVKKDSIRVIESLLELIGVTPTFVQ